MSIHSLKKQSEKGTAKPSRTRATPRQPHDPQRRAEILQAALRVFARKGFHRATIRDIAGEAGLADGTIYNHFENKNSLLLALLEGLNQSGQRDASLAISDDEDLSTFLPRHFKLLLDTLTQGTGDALGVILAELLTNAELREAYARQLVAPIHKLGEAALTDWAAQGRVRSGDVELRVRAVNALLLGLIVQRLLGDPVLAERWDELPAVVADFVLRGIGKEVA